MVRTLDFDKLKSLAYYSLSEGDALSLLRVVGPATFAGLEVIYGVKNGEISIDAVSKGDIVLIQRDICRHHDIYEQIIYLAHSENKPVIFDIDDLLFELPDDHPDRISGYFTESLLPMLQAIIEADLVTVATAPLRDYLLPFNEAVEVIPNYLNDSLWKFKSIDNSQRQDNVVTIGYMGGHSHTPDLLMVLPALKIINEKYPNRIRYHFWGIEPPEELIGLSQVDWCPPKSSYYQDFVNFFQNNTADIGIGPLCDNIFNACKSPIKYLEYGANGLPGVYSCVKPYSDIVTNGVDGYLASTIYDWVEMLTALIETLELRKEFLLNAQHNIRQNWLLSDNYHNQFRLYKDSINQIRSVQIKSPTTFNIVRQLSGQYYEEFNRIKFRNKTQLDPLQKTDQNGQLLHNQLYENRQKVQLLNDQLKESNKRILLMSTQLIDDQKIVQTLKNQINIGQAKENSLREQLGDRDKQMEVNNSKMNEEETTIHSLSTQNEELQNEILSYVMSKSWIWTRPFRKIIYKIRQAFK
ncbi:MAG: hypothetical protein EHM34_02910 [Nitrosopumilales archaeon]|nr:MAG: hypothetical protein EHM34_02910 [Nitrosopumilales archaeon]